MSDLDRSGRAGADKRWPLEIPPSSTFHEGCSAGLSEASPENVSESPAGEEYGRTWTGPEREKTHVPLNTSKGFRCGKAQLGGQGHPQLLGRQTLSSLPSDAWYNLQTKWP